MAVYKRIAAFLKRLKAKLCRRLRGPAHEDHVIDIPLLHHNGPGLPAGPAEPQPAAPDAGNVIATALPEAVAAPIVEGPKAPSSGLSEGTSTSTDSTAISPATTGPATTEPGAAGSAATGPDTTPPPRDEDLERAIAFALMSPLALSDLIPSPSSTEQRPVYLPPQVPENITRIARDLAASVQLAESRIPTTGSAPTVSSPMASGSTTAPVSAPSNPTPAPEDRAPSEHPSDYTSGRTTPLLDRSSSGESYFMPRVRLPPVGNMAPSNASGNTEQPATPRPVTESISFPQPDLNINLVTALDNSNEFLAYLMEGCERGEKGGSPKAPPKTGEYDFTKEMDEYTGLAYWLVDLISEWELEDRERSPKEPVRDTARILEIMRDVWNGYDKLGSLLVMGCDLRSRKFSSNKPRDKCQTEWANYMKLRERIASLFPNESKRRINSFECVKDYAVDELLRPYIEPGYPRINQIQKCKAEDGLQSSEEPIDLGVDGRLGRDSQPELRPLTGLEELIIRVKKTEIAAQDKNKDDGQDKEQESPSSECQNDDKDQNPPSDDAPPTYDSPE
ncbi:hypothetical protein NPX13_g306 [Xylaria arbuscula]|uniref:Uncharacterized protein n=1 Tax=Xylaria arbuscula TaxID=114810 RepID=A0A9W8NPG3_9PEZI|nr:hypothetical protein NPX13_g306 [Xylaria arbuscula]